MYSCTLNALAAGIVTSYDSPKHLFVAIWKTWSSQKYMPYQSITQGPIVTLHDMKYSLPAFVRWSQGIWVSGVCSFSKITIDSVPIVYVILAVSELMNKFFLLSSHNPPLLLGHVWYNILCHILWRWLNILIILKYNKIIKIWGIFQVKPSFIDFLL